MLSTKDWSLSACAACYSVGFRWGAGTRSPLHPERYVPPVFIMVPHPPAEKPRKVPFNFITDDILRDLNKPIPSIRC